MIVRFILKKMNFSNIKLLIFDLDDTLYPEYEYILSGFQAVAELVSSRTSFTSTLLFGYMSKEFDNGNHARVFDSLLNHFKLGSIRTQDLISVYREHDPKIQLFDHYHEFLFSLKLRFKLAIISDGYYMVQKKKIEALGLGSYFDKIEITDKYGLEYWKPSTKCFINVLRQFDVRPSEALYIADNPAKDFKAPNKLGMLTIRFQLEGGIYSELIPESRSYEPMLTIKTTNELMELFQV